MPPVHAVETRPQVDMHWRGKQSEALLATAREVCIEGAIRSGKTTECLWKEHAAVRQYPGIPIMLARWTDDAVHGLVAPLWVSICERAGDRQT